MKIKDIFLKPVDRPIEGVIKADDISNLIREIDEYVITNEISKKLGHFLDAYLNEESSNGVWISGFFGSGKSHLLKMLSLLLQNWQEGTCSILSSFISKCHDDEILIAELKRAVKIPSKSILFNIDQKADLISKQQTDALLAVFVKVFDEFCGYYGKQGHIAKFERDLDKRGIYQNFQNEYKSIAGKSWEIGREEAILESANISLAYEKVAGNGAAAIKGVLDKYRNDYKVSIEDFARQVWEYIESQEPNFRLNFFVDEVGQFIADNTKLMLNLQTIAESLATICKGRAWITVTSQEDLDAVVGELNQSSSNDFSKIQARFRTRLSLTSANVDEVIQKRLLHKNESAIDPLSELYHIHQNSFRTMFDFVDGAQTYRNFSGKDDFIYSYPYIPYQFSLFQKAIKSLSANQAFEGRHRSVGERSMLGVFQQVVKTIISFEVGRIATFDLMFDGIRSSIKSQIQGAIINAETNLEDAFAIRILKVLFMLKYVKDFKATVRNVSILMLESFDSDINTLRETVFEALSKLESQTYIQRNGDMYEYLTNEEKDVEQEIKNTTIDNVALLDKLDEILFSSAQIVKSLKIRYEENKQDFPYTRRIDNKQFGKEHEITIQVITPLSEYYDFDDEKQTIAHALGKPELTVLLPADKRFWDDLKISLQTQKCYDLNYNSLQKETAKKILYEKRELNKDRLILVKNRLAELVCDAKIYAGGDPQIIELKDANTRIIQAFQIVVGKVYPYLKMLKGVSYSEQEIGKFLDYSQIKADFAATLSEAEQEVFSHVTSQSREGKKCTVQDLMEKFSRKPYGWGFYAILCQLAKLYAAGKVEVYSDGSVLENSNLEKALKNTQKHSSLIIQTQQEYTPSQVRRLKELYGTLFDLPSDETDAKALAKETTQQLAVLVKKLEDIISKQSDYPFVTCLNPIFETLKASIGKHYSWYYTDFITHDEEYTRTKLELIDPIVAFMNSEQRSIYYSIKSFLKDHEPNLSYLDIDKVNELTNGFADSLIYKGSRIQKLKAIYDILKDKLERLVNEEKKQALETLENYYRELIGSQQYLDSSSGIKEMVEQSLNSTKSRISSATIIAVIKDAIIRFGDIEYPKLMKLFQDKVEPNEPVKPKTVVDISSIDIGYSSSVVNNELDLNNYLKYLRNALLSELRKGNGVRIKPMEKNND